MKTIDPTTLADVAIFAPLAILPALKKEVPEPLILGAFLYTTVRASSIIYDLLSEPVPSQEEQEKSVEIGQKRLDSFTYK